MRKFRQEKRPQGATLYRGTVIKSNEPYPRRTMDKMFGKKAPGHKHKSQFKWLPNKRKNSRMTDLSFASDSVRTRAVRFVQCTHTPLQATAARVTHTCMACPLLLWWLFLGCFCFAFGVLFTPQERRAEIREEKHAKARNLQITAEESDEKSESESGAESVETSSPIPKPAAERFGTTDPFAVKKKKKSHKYGGGDEPDSSSTEEESDSTEGEPEFDDDTLADLNSIDDWASMPSELRSSVASTETPLTMWSEVAPSVTLSEWKEVNKREREARHRAKMREARRKARWEAWQAKKPRGILMKCVAVGWP